MTLCWRLNVRVGATTLHFCGTFLTMKLSMRSKLIGYNQPVVNCKDISYNEKRKRAWHINTVALSN